MKTRTRLFMTHLAHTLNCLVTEHHLEPSRLAWRAGIPRTDLNRLLAGEIPHPNYETLVGLLTAFAPDPRAQSALIRACCRDRQAPLPAIPAIPL